MTDDMMVANMRRRVEKTEEENSALRAELAALRERVKVLEEALSVIQEVADDELRRLGAVPGSNIPQIEANAAAALAQPPVGGAT